jgi:transposase
MLQPFVSYLQGRWQSGCTNVTQLKRELEAQGYRGSYSLMMQALSPWRDPRPPPDPTSRRRRGRPRVKRINVRWLCLRPPGQLEPHECDALQNILADDDRLAAGYELLQRFRQLINRRSVRDFIQWLVDAGASGLRPFASLARGIEADYAAVVNGLKLPWSAGPVEGTVTRVKLLKRQGYGRASTRLLRRRVISAA